MQNAMMKITSPTFEEGKKIPSKYTCEGENINPELHFEEIPPETKALVLIMDDPDVPPSVRPECMYDHWVVFNIPPHTTTIPENSPPFGTPGSNTKGELKYIGPCPRGGEHRYFFKLYALNQELALDEGATKTQVEEAMQDRILAKAVLMGRYEKKNNH